MSPISTYSLQPHSGDAEQPNNPWNSRSDGQDLSPSTATATNRQRSDSFRTDDAIVWRDCSDMIISPSPPPQSDQPIHAQPPMQETETPPTDPHIASLKAIFPDFDDAVILSVLESTDHDHDRALDVLLGMNDPSFVPPNPPPPQVPNQFQSAPTTDAHRLSQEALDEQLARRLALEEQQAAAQAWQPQGMEGQTMYQAYQPRRAGRYSWGSPPQGQPQTQGQGARDTRTEFQEGFSRIAESGKKTFSSIVSKVRAKMQDFDQGQGWTWSQNSPAGQPSQAASASYYPSNTPGQQQGYGQGTYAQPYQPPPPAGPQRQTSQSRPIRTNSSLSSPPRSGVLRPGVSESAQSTGPQQSSYYDPNARGYDLYDDDDEIQIHDRTTPPVAHTTTPPVTTQSPATPPRADSPATQTPPPNTNSSPSYASPVTPPPSSGPPPTSPPARSLSPTNAGARGTTPGAPSNVDFSKLGLLPKRPISLVQPQNPPATGAGAGAVAAAGAGVSAPRVAAAHSQSTTDSSTEYEETEFVENPFEDPR